MKTQLWAILLLLILFIGGTFAFTIATHRAHDQDLELISLAGRQRMLNQLHIKEILLASQGIEADYLSPRFAFNQTLEAFLAGDRMIYFPEAGEVLMVPKVTDPATVELLHALKTAMEEFSAKADLFLQLPTGHDTDMAALSDLLEMNMSLQNLVNQSVVRLTQTLENRDSIIIQWEIVTGILTLCLGLMLAHNLFLAGRRRDREIEEREKAEINLRHQYAITRILSEDQDIYPGISRILDSMATGFHWAVACYWEVHPETQVLRCREWSSFSRTSLLRPFVDTITHFRLTKGMGFPGHIWQTGLPARIETIPDDLSFLRAPIAIQSGLHGAIGFPVLIGSEVVGVIEAFSYAPEPVDPDLLSRLSSLGKQIGQFIQRQQDRATVAESEAHLVSILQRAYDAVISVNDVHQIQLFNQGAEQLFGYRAEEVIGQSLDHLFPLALPINVDQVQNSVETMMRSGQKEGSTVRIDGRRKNGTRISTEARICKNDSHRTLAFTIILRESLQRPAMAEAVQQSDKC